MTVDGDGTNAQPTPGDPPGLYVDAAVAALKAFSGNDLAQSMAAWLLPFWEHYRHLSPSERAEVVRRFRDPLAIPPVDHDDDEGSQRLRLGPCPTCLAPEVDGHVSHESTCARTVK